MSWTITICVLIDLFVGMPLAAPCGIIAVKNINGSENSDSLNRIGTKLRAQCMKWGKRIAVSSEAESKKNI